MERSAARVAPPSRWGSEGAGGRARRALGRLLPQEAGGGRASGLGDLLAARGAGREPGGGALLRAEAVLVLRRDGQTAVSVRAAEPCACTRAVGASLCPQTPCGLVPLSPRPTPQGGTSAPAVPPPPRRRQTRQLTACQAARRAPSRPPTDGPRHPPGGSPTGKGRPGSLPKPDQGQRRHQARGLHWPLRSRAPRALLVTHSVKRDTPCPRLLPEGVRAASWTAEDPLGLPPSAPRVHPADPGPRAAGGGAEPLLWARGPEVHPEGQVGSHHLCRAGHAGRRGVQVRGACRAELGRRLVLGVGSSLNEATRPRAPAGVGGGAFTGRWSVSV